MPRDAEATRSRIMDAAQVEIMKRGFSATSVDAIHEAAGVSRGTFFYHFPTKDDLARALLDRYADTDRRITDRLMARAEELSRDPLHQVLIFLRLHDDVLASYDREEDPGCLFASYSYEAGLFDEETHRVISDSIDHWRQVLAGKLAEAAEWHQPRGPADPAVLADLAYGMLQGGFILSRVRGSARLMVEQLRQFVALLESLYGVDGGEDMQVGEAGSGPVPSAGSR